MGQHRASPFHHPNVSADERLLTGLTAVSLLALAAARPRARAPLAIASALLAARAATGYCPMYSALEVDRRSAAARLSGPRGNHLDAQITIAQPPEAVYALWRDLDRLDQALPPRLHVAPVDDKRSEWRVTTADGQRTLATWTAEIVNDVPDKVLAWRTTAEALVASAGSVHFDPAPGGQGTEVRVRLQYAPPLGHAGAGLASLSPVNPSRLLATGLASIKRYLELGRAVVLTA